MFIDWLILMIFYAYVYMVLVFKYLLYVIEII